MIRLVLLGALIIAAVAAGPTSGRAQVSGGGPALRVQWEADQGGYVWETFRLGCATWTHFLLRITLPSSDVTLWPPLLRLSNR